jgi:glucosamine-6-phosphate deaminase
MELKVTENHQESSCIVADIFADVIQKTPDALLGCATGSSVVDVYGELTKKHKQGLDFSSIRTVNLDEYVGLGYDHHKSFSYFMEQHFFSKTNLSWNNVFLVDGSKNAGAELNRFNAFLEKNTIDVLMLGVGTNGHIGFNEPNSTFPVAAHEVALSSETIQSNARFFDRESDVPRKAITLGMRDILKSRKVILIASGKSKADTIGKLLWSQNADPYLPCSILRLCRDSLVVIDAELYEASGFKSMMHKS